MLIVIHTITLAQQLPRLLARAARIHQGRANSAGSTPDVEVLSAMLV